ncbi:MAG TPA: hypothetical protein VFA99_06760 [Acidobacteriaceae bacterium]|nr:hypothetical protein [Acidobacteriaceae bacterium]
MLRGIRSSFMLAALAAGVAVPALAQELPHEGPVPTTALVNVESKNAVQLDPRGLTLQVNGHETPITSVRSAASGNEEIAILIDDGLRTNFGLQLNEISNFVKSLPPNAKVLVGYMENGTVRSSGHFTADHQEIASQIRVPIGVPGQSASPYFCLSDFVKHWPSQEPAARFVLMITNGVDPYNGRASLMNQDSPYVQAAQDDAIRAGVAVYSIYFQDSGFRGGRGSLSGQSYLQQVGDATGGTLFNQGPITPVSIGPYLNQFEHAINSSYELGFMANAQGKRDTLVRIKVKSNQSGVKVHAPEEVRAGLDEMTVAER